VAQVVGGLHHSCAAHRDGSVRCWGLAESIRAGGAAVLPPAVVAGVDRPLGLSAGAGSTCAVKEDGSELSGAISVALGPAFGCALDGQGTWCWGKNDFGQLGRPLVLDASARAVLSVEGPRRLLAAGMAVVTLDDAGSGRLCAWGDNLGKVVTAADGIRVYISPQCGAAADVAELSAGEEHACLRHGDGSFACWGERYYGQLGTGGGEKDTADVPPYGAATRLGGPVASLVAGKSHTCALLASGSVTCFGRNNAGQIGPAATGPLEEVRAPTEVTGFSGKVVALGAGSSAQHTCAILQDGSLQCWGSDDDGQLGDGVVSIDPARFSRAPTAVRF
jgi:alpha-tubulin suppressor-like RCC1 family protein